jgi:hypothetical protein
VKAAELKRLALALPETSEKPCYGTSGFYVKKKLFARLLPGEREVVVRMTLEHRDAALRAKPKIFALTPHYEPHPWVIVRLGAVTPKLMRDVLEEGWRLQRPLKARATGT